MGEAGQRLEELKNDLASVYREAGRCAEVADAVRSAALVIRIIREHRRWDGQGEQLWEGVVDLTAIGHLSRYLDTRALRLRVRTYCFLQTYYVLGADARETFDLAFQPRQNRGPRRALEAVENSLSSGLRIRDLPIRILCTLQAANAPVREQERVFDETFERLREVRDARFYWSSVGRAAAHEDELILDALTPHVLGAADRLRRVYRHAAWDRAVTAITAARMLAAAGQAGRSQREAASARRKAAVRHAVRAIGAMHLAVPRARPPDRPPFRTEDKIQMAGKIERGLGDAFVARLALRTSAVVGNIHNLSDALAAAYQGYDGAMTAEREARARRREILVKLLGAALTPLIGPLASVVSDAASAALEAGIRAFDGGAGELTRSVSTLMAPLPRQVAEQLGALKKAARGELVAAGDEAKEKLEEALSPEKVAERVGDRVLADRAPPSLQDALRDALNEELELFLTSLQSAIVSVQEDLTKHLLSASAAPAATSSGASAATPAVLRSRELAVQALWHVHRTHEEDGRKTYPVEQALLDPTYTFLEAFFDRQKESIQDRFAFDRLEIRRPEGLDRLLEWKLWGLHLDAEWKGEGDQAQLEQIAKLSSSEVASRLAEIEFLELTSDDQRDRGIIRFSRLRLGAGATALAGAFVRYIVDEFQPFTVLTGSTSVGDLLEEKKRAVQHIYDARAQLLAASQTATWQTVWARAQSSLAAAATA